MFLLGAQVVPLVEICVSSSRNMCPRKKKVGTYYFEHFVLVLGHTYFARGISCAPSRNMCLSKKIVGTYYFENFVLVLEQTYFC